jgi:hypothetical protein
MKKIFIFILFFFCIKASAQLDYATKFNNGKSLFNDKKYNLAMETLKPLMTYDRNNAYTEYATFYYAASAYHQGFKAVAKITFNQIKTLYPTWDKMNEVNYWMAKIHFEEQDYFQALKVLAGITDKKFETDIQVLKESGLRSVTDPETLRMMLEEYPKDAVVAKALASILAKNLSDEEGKKQLEDLIAAFKLTRTDFIPEAPKTFFKEKYAVALMMPFMVGSLEPTPGRKRAQIMLDFYEGAKLAIDTLSKQNIQISLRAYDTERNVDKLNRYLETEEIKNADLIIGPVFQEENKIVQDFSAQYRINVIHPFSNLSETIGMNPHAFLFQPTAETLGRKSADFLNSKLKHRDKDCMIFYGPGKKDSILALSFQQRAVELGVKVLSSLKVTNTKTAMITEILATPTEFDEFKYPSQFTLPKDSLHSIFVASDDPLIYTKIVGAVETRNDSVVVVGSENWIDDNAIEFEKYQSLGIVLASPNYRRPSNFHVKAFERKFMLKHGRLASNMARMGYELVMFTGHQLKTNGVYFQDGLTNSGILPGYVGEGFDYRFGRDNQVVPFTTFKQGEYILIEKR